VRRRVAIVAALVCVAVVGAGCGERHEVTSARTPTKVSVMLDFFPNADHAGLYAALAGGGFARQGLDVTVRTPASPSEPLALLAAGKVDLAISYEPELLLARDTGAPLVSVAAIVQRPLTSIIALDPRRVPGPKALAGKTIGTAGIPYQDAYLTTILQNADVPASSVKRVNVGFNLVPAMLTGKVDATLGGFWNYEAIQLRQMHHNPTVIPVDHAGVPTYDELVVVARAGELAHKPQIFRAFLQALGQGYRAVRANPAAGVNPLMKANPNLNRGLQFSSVKATGAAFFPADPSKPFGYQNLKQWVAFGRWMTAHGLLHKRPIIAQAATNDLLPGQGE
jgi:putative hydroxymethylpyrimidine transport system substrate-binding protein